MNPSKKNPQNSEHDQGIAAGHEQQILDTASIGILISRISDGTVLYANKAIASLWGVTDIDSVIGTQVRDFYWDAKDRKAILERLRTEGSITNNDLRARRVDGSMTWVSISIRPFNFKGEQALLTEIVDISERKRAEKTAFESEEQFRTLYNNATIGLYRTTPEGQILMINPTGLRLLGFDSFEELAQRNLEQAGFEEVDARKKFREKLEREGVIEQESVWTKKDGTPIFVRESSTLSRDESGNILYYDGSFEDITAHKQAEEALRTSEERFKRFTEVTVEGLVFHEQGKIIDANPAGLAMFGLSENSEFIGRNLLEFIVPEFHKTTLQQMQLETVLPYEIQCIRKDGSTFPVETSTRTYKVGDKTIRASSIRDITERRQMEQTLRDTDVVYSAVVMQAKDGVVIIQDNVLQFMNKSMGDMLGYTLPEMENTPFINYVVSENKPLVANRIKAHLAGEDVPPRYEIGLERKDGMVVLAELSAGVKEYRGKPAYVAMIRDISERKQSEEALRESEQRFGRFIESTIEGLIFHEQGRIVDANPAAFGMFGFSENSEFIGKNLLGFIAPESHEMILKQMPTETNMAYDAKYIPTYDDASSIILESEPVHYYEIQCMREDGSTFPAETSTYNYGVGNRTIRATSIRDITERKQAEEALRESQQLLQLVMDNIPQSIFWKDRNLTYLGCNSAFAANIGLASPSDVVGKTDLDISSKDRAELYRADDSLVIKSGTPKLNFEEPQTHADGLTYWLRTSKIPMQDVNGNIFAVLGMYEDITERKQADQTLRESQQLLQLVMDNIPQSVFWKDKNLTYIGANQAFAEDAGFASFREVAGKSDFDMPWKEQAQLYRADDQRVLESGETKLNYEEPQTGPTGKVTWLRTSKIPMQDVNGNIFGVLGAYEDITERKQLEQQVQTAFERRGYQVQVSTEISQEVAAASELNELFERVVTLTKERLGYYHTQVLRYNPSQDAVVLVSGYGETGRKMLADGHQMPMGSGLIGTAAASGETVLRPTLADDPDWHPNPLLPDTLGEIAVPIKLGDQILGVLDVQSDQAGSLTEDDRLLLEGICGQIAVAMEQTRLRQEMAERLEEVNRLYSSMSHEGWKTYRETADLPTGFVFDQAGVKPVGDMVFADENFAQVPMKVLGGEVVGTLSVANDPRNPTSLEDLVFLQQVSDQVALALEGARLSAQTQSALAQTEKLSEAGLLFTRASGLQEVIKIAVETLGISKINRAALETFNYNMANEVESMDVLANWWNGTGHQTTTVGTRYTPEVLPLIQLFLTPIPMFIKDAFQDERVDGVSLQIVKKLNIHAVAVLPLFLADQQIGVLLLESEEIHEFNQDEIRLFSAMGPQISTVLENRRQFERAQKQAEREGLLNIISQKIQGATSVEAVLQIAARELGHALGAPMTIAQLSMKDKK